jgi:Lon protease-like protein
MADEHLNPDGAVIRLFPLPNVVLFPGAMLPLHIFEPRYRQMTADALAGDRLIAMALPRPGWEQDYAGKPAIHPVACVGRVVAEQALDDGRYNILLRGVARVRIVEEVASTKQYRVAQFEQLDEISAGPAEETQRRAELRARASQWFHDQAKVRDRFLELIDGEIGLGALADVIAFMLPLDAEFKQTLLAELEVTRRLDRLEQQLAVTRRPFPPEFSTN